jgi:hypothetical protein
LVFTESVALRLNALILLSALTLAACGQEPGAGAAKPGEDPRYAGLDAQILKWGGELEQTNAACREKVNGKGCQDFEVACKGERPITPAEQAQGVTAKVVAAMTFNGWSAKTSDYRPASAFAEFAKAGSTWTRSEAKPVNLTTCAAY